MTVADIVTAASIDSRIVARLLNEKPPPEFGGGFFRASRLPLRAQKIECRKNFHRKPQAANESALRALRIPFSWSCFQCVWRLESLPKYLLKTLDLEFC
jgi:hypothetical protein